MLLPFLWPYVETRQRPAGVAAAFRGGDVVADPRRLPGGDRAPGPMLSLTLLSGLAWRPDGRHCAGRSGTFPRRPSPRSGCRWDRHRSGAARRSASRDSTVCSTTTCPGSTACAAASRFAMVLMLALASLAGIGVALLSRHRSWGRGVAMAALTAHHRALLERAAAARCPGGHRHAAPGAGLPGAERAAVGRLPAARRCRPRHGRRRAARSASRPTNCATCTSGCRIAGRLNGYSGIFPASYRARTPALRTPWTNPDAAWQALAPASTSWCTAPPGSRPGPRRCVSGWSSAARDRSRRSIGVDRSGSCPTRP